MNGGKMIFSITATLDSYLIPAVSQVLSWQAFQFSQCCFTTLIK